MFSLLKASNNWRINLLLLENNNDYWTNIASAPTTNGHINQIIKNYFGNDGLNLDALRKSWDIPDQMPIQNVAFFDQLDIGGGGRRRNLNVEAEWHRVVDLLLQMTRAKTTMTLHLNVCIKSPDNLRIKH